MIGQVVMSAVSSLSFDLARPTIILPRVYLCRYDTENQSKRWLLSRSIIVVLIDLYIDWCKDRSICMSIKGLILISILINSTLIKRLNRSIKRPYIYRSNDLVSQSNKIDRPHQLNNQISISRLSHIDWTL